MYLKAGILIVYALMIIIIGTIAMRRTRSFFSAVLFIGFAGKVGWGFGYSGVWIAVGNALVGVLGVWWLIGHRIKKMSVEYNVHTMAEYLDKRYDSKFLKLFAALSVFVFFVPYSAAVFMGLSYLFRSTFGMTMIDVVFGVIMVVGVSLLLVITLDRGEGLENISAGLSAINPKLIAALSKTNGRSGSVWLPRPVLPS